MNRHGPAAVPGGTKAALILLCAAISVRAVDHQAPLWFGELPQGYIAARGEGDTPDKALDAAWKSIFSQIARTATTSVAERFFLVAERINGSTKEAIRNHLTTEGYYHRDGAPLLQLVADDRTFDKSGNRHRHYLLVCLNAGGCECRLVYPDNTAAAVRSALLPGLGHLYKGRTRRGIGFSAVTLFTVAGGFIAVGMSANAFNSAADARTAEVNRYWRDRGIALHWGGIAALAAGAGLYLWNIFDARGCEGVPELR